MILSAIFGLLLSAIALDGVVGSELTARARFDANNVRVGDPMILTIDFIGSAQFQDLHPPAISKEVDSRVWKVDDASAKTETYQNARRLVYRLRPLREGLFRFPALVFRWSDGADAPSVREAVTTEIPVHVKQGVQAALGLDADDERAMPDGIVCEVVGLSDDEVFRWRKACNKPSADAFAAFDFPEAKMNEAACAIVEGNWARALRIYSSLEWRTGQTPAMERGIAAAKGELPAWRFALRPLLRFDWRKRSAIVLGGVLALALFFWGSSRLIRRLAALAVVLSLATGAFAQDPFDALDKMHEQMMQRMNSLMNGMDPFGSGSGFQIGPGSMTMSINGQQPEPLNVTASLAISTNDVRVGETFRYILSIESPRSTTLDQLRFAPSEMFGMVFVGKPETLTDAQSANPSNRVRRIAIPVRYDVPFKGDVSVRVDGMASRRQQSGRSSFSFSQNFSAQTQSVPVEIKPLPTDNQPADFAGAIGTGFKLTQSVDRQKVETNDVVVVTKAVEYSGYLPLGAVKDEVERRLGSHFSRVSWQEYFVADGAQAVPAAAMCWYDTDSRTYKTAVARPVPLEYVAPDESAVAEAKKSVAVDAALQGGVRTVILRFAPSDDAPVVERVKLMESDAPLVETERRGDWIRLDSGAHAGWTRVE